MAIDDLERELQALSKPHEADERLRLAIRRQLVEQSQPQARRRLSKRTWIVSAAAAAAVAAVVVALVGTNGSGGPTPANAAIIHHALRAVTPKADCILHVKVVGMQNGVAIAGEWWQETSAPYASRGIKGPIGHEGESADDGTTSFTYDPGTNTIFEQPDSRPPTFEDPVSQVRKELEAGDAQVVGTAVLDGVSLYKVDLPHGLVGYFDQTNYRPRYLDNPQRDGTVVRLRVVAYGYLDMTQSNRALLSITAQHPTGRIDSNPSDAPSGK